MSGIPAHDFKKVLGKKSKKTFTLMKKYKYKKRLVCIFTSNRVDYGHLKI